MAIEEMHLGNLATSWCKRARIRQTIVGRTQRVPGRQIAPILADVECGRLSVAAVGLGLYQREMVGIAVVIGICGSSLDGIGLNSGGCWSWEADNGFGRKEYRVDSSCLAHTSTDSLERKEKLQGTRQEMQPVDVECNLLPDGGYTSDVAEPAKGAALMVVGAALA